MKKKYDFSITEVARKFGVGPATIYNRIYEGWPVEKAISTPPRKRNKRIFTAENPCNKREYKTLEESCFSNVQVFADESELKKENYVVDFSPLGGWRIMILNRPKCREYKFQAYNTVTGEFFKSNNSEEIKRIMYKIFANL